MCELGALEALLRCHCLNGKTVTPLEKLTLYRLTTSTPPTNTLYFPRLCLVINGKKRIQVGHHAVQLSAGQIWTCSLDIPVTAQVDVEEEEHQALTIKIERDVLAEMLEHVTVEPSPDFSEQHVAEIDEAFRDALQAYMALLNEPDHRQALEPLRYREVIYRLLHLPYASSLLGLFGSPQRLQKINKATEWLKANYHRPVVLDELCEVTNMSSSALHKHFKALTSLSPLQYRAQLRLHDARRRLLSGERDIGLISLYVGYESPSQFTREYKRFFGTTPSNERI